MCTGQGYFWVVGNKLLLSQLLDGQISRTEQNREPKSEQLIAAKYKNAKNDLFGEAPLISIFQCSLFQIN